jgi:sterol desaturase/sphingolipid hydroxylase (fatty acid hydroxylase superfamily)
MKADEILMLLTPLTYLVMLGVEALFPARKFPKVKWWRAVGLFGFVMVSAVGIVTPLLLPLSWLEKHRLFDATKLGVPLGVVVGYMVSSLFAALWHRALHKSNLLWRLFHQIHHAPQRLDLSGSVVFHPLDIFMFTVVPTVGLTLTLGIDPLAAAIVGYVSTFYAFFQHWNVKTPRILGYLIQRPEAHCHHHELEVHASNYSDFPLWDLLLGSFKSPATFDGKVGFAKPGGYLKMLAFKNVNNSNDDNNELIAAGRPSQSPSLSTH